MKANELTPEQRCRALNTIADWHFESLSFCSLLEVLLRIDMENHPMIAHTTGKEQHNEA